MPIKRKPQVPIRQHAIGNLALAPEPVESIPSPAAPRRRVAQETIPAPYERDLLAPARGIVVGIGLSIILWGLILIVLIIVW